MERRNKNLILFEDFYDVEPIPTIWETERVNIMKLFRISKTIGVDKFFT